MTDNFPSGDLPGMPLIYVLPGLLLISGMEILVLLGIIQVNSGLQWIITALMVVLPWSSLLISRLGFDAFAYRKERFFFHLGWGMVAGGIWRLGNVLLNFYGLQLAGILESALDISVAILWVPFVEETFFRAYIGRSISRSWGVVPGIVIQALVFTLLPSHVAQGMWHILSIFAFGVLAGWLLHVRRSIWAPWGAHAFANLLPLLVLGIY